MNGSANPPLPVAAALLLAALVGRPCTAQMRSHPPAAPATTAALSVVLPVTDCGSLVEADISGAVGAKTHVTSAVAIREGKPAPYCLVTGYVAPMVKFEVHLPLATWTQRFVQTGCGGLCGNLDVHLRNADGCDPAEHGELVLASTDMGHSGGMDGQFGEKDYQLRIDFAYRGVHVTTLAAKALITAFYGQPAKYSYFSGCSDGGREALIEAERYPQDFNGITAGAPAMNFTTQNTFYHGWNALKNTGADGKAILTTDTLPILHQAALAACDAADGLKDGLISNPLACHFDPGVIECRKGQDPGTCLTQEQVQAARDIYAGAHDRNGDKLVLSGPLPGSELAWEGVFVPRSGGEHSMSSMISTGSLKYLVYSKNPPTGYTLSDLQFTRESFAATTQLHPLYDATDPDLSAFAGNGGKLILWHGLADPHISPLNSIAYYTAMDRVMGESQVRKFARLYLFPGGYHCGGGEGPFRVDLLSAIMAWVEGETAPFRLVASHQQAGSPGPPAGVTDAADRTRPVFPYPLTTKYNGKGNIDDALNYSPGPLSAVSTEQLQWLGASFYTPDYEIWCHGDGASMACKPTP